MPAENDLPLMVLVDDEVHTLQSIKRLLRKLPVSIKEFDSPFPAKTFLEQNKVSLIISDQRMPGMTGIELLTEVRAISPDCHTLLLSAYEDFDTVANAISSGVVDKFISKPWQNDELKFFVENALPVERQSFSRKAQEQSSYHGLISSAQPMQSVFDTIHRAATSNAPIFIHGETGTGKELVARACHWESFQNNKPFVPFNCANFNEQLMESQLFGHVKGAFTGATNNQKGLFSVAQDGTVFLDEITTLPLTLQAKLLRVLQEREFTPLGSHQSEKFNAHIISASSTSLNEAVAKGEFREDLNYRLNVVPINLPPLKERKGDINLLSRHFLDKFNKIEGKSFSHFEPSGIALLNDYRWPGNVRQLENLIHNLVILNDGPEVTRDMISSALAAFQPLSTQVKPDSLPQSNPLTNQNIQALWKTEKQAIETAIEYCGGNIVKAAALLEISPSTIYRKMSGWEGKG